MLDERIKYFMHAYESPNFSVAASRIPMSPQGFTKAIRGLEKDLDVPLFITNESGKKISTPYADQLYQYAQNVNQEKARLLKTFEDLTTTGCIDLPVVFSLGIPGLIANDLNDRFKKRCPEASIAVIEMPDKDCANALLNGEYSLGLIVLPTDGKLNSQELYSTNVCCWINRANPLSNKEVITISDLEDQCIAMPGHHYNIYTSIVRHFSDAGIENPNILERCELMWIYEEVCKNRAVGFSLPYMTKLAAFSNRDDIVCVPLEGEVWRFGLVSSKTSLNKYEEAFTQCVIESCNALKRDS